MVKKLRDFFSHYTATITTLTNVSRVVSIWNLFPILYTYVYVYYILILC